MVEQHERNGRFVLVGGPVRGWWLVGVVPCGVAEDVVFQLQLEVCQLARIVTRIIVVVVPVMMRHATAAALVPIRREYRHGWCSNSTAAIGGGSAVGQGVDERPCQRALPRAGIPREKQNEWATTTAMVVMVPCVRGFRNGLYRPWLSDKWQGVGR